MTLTFRAVLKQSDGLDAAYVDVPYDIRALTGRGRWAVRAAFDGEPYDGQVVRMGTPGWVIGVTKAVRRKIGKTFGDEIDVTLTGRSEGGQKHDDA